MDRPAAGRAAHARRELAGARHAQDHRPGRRPRDALPPGGQYTKPAVYVRHDVPWSGASAWGGGVFDWQARFLQDYVGATLQTGANNKWLAHSKSVLFCPSSPRFGRAIATSGPGTESYGTGITPISYWFAGLAPVTSLGGTFPHAGYSLFRSTEFWQPRRDQFGNVLFSFCTGDTNGTDLPHAPNGRLEGTNLVQTDGAARWVAPSQMLTHTWNPGLSREVPRGFRIPLLVSIGPGVTVRVVRGTGADTYEPAANYGIRTPNGYVHN